MRKLLLPLVVVSLLLLAAACSGGKKPATPTAAASQTAPGVTATPPAIPATPTPESYGGVTVQPLTLGADFQLPTGLVVYYNVSGYGKGGGPGLLFRAYRTAGGGLRVDQLGASVAAQGPTTWQATDFEHGLVATEICVRGMCATGENQARPGSEAHLFISQDGGISWTDQGALPDDTFVYAIAPGQTILCTCRPGQPDHFWRFPSGEDIQAPEPRFYPTNMQNVGLVWEKESSAGREVRDWTGAPLASTAVEPGSVQPDFFVESAIGREFAFRVTWFIRNSPAASAGSGLRYILATHDANNAVVAAYSWDGESIGFSGLISPSRILGNVYLSSSVFGLFPVALVDLNTRSVQMIPELSATKGAPFARGALVGNFARVATGGTDCLNVRETATAGAPIITCLHDGVLVRVLPTPPIDPAPPMIPIQLLDGRQGWAASEFLER